MIGPWFYAGTFVLLLLTMAPLLYVVALALALKALGITLSDTTAILLTVGAYLLNTYILVSVWRSSSSPALSFWDGLKIISARYMSGCANITLIYIYPVLFVAYLAAAYHALLGLSHGPDYPRVEWLKQAVPQLRSKSLHSAPSTGQQTPTVGGKPETLKKCPYCAEMIRADAVFCRYCGHDTRVAVPTVPPGNGVT
jgi:hypothetical protein